MVKDSSVLKKLEQNSVFGAGEYVLEGEMRTAALKLAEVTQAENLAVAEGLRCHDPELLDELIVRYQHRLLRYLLYLTGNREQAEDMFQETWMRVLQRGSQ